MNKVITYGTFDLLHYGHINLLKRAKALGDYLIVGVTSDSYDLERGKLNVQQSLLQRIDNVRETGFADEIIVEEFEGQKISDIQKMGINTFVIGSDWEGKFDFLKDKKCWCFVAGIATAVVGKKIATSDKVRSMCVSGLAKGMKFQQEAKETLQNMREEAEDMCYEAKSQLNDEEE